MGEVIPLHRQPLFHRVVIVPKGEKAHIFLAGPNLGGKPRPVRWMEAVPARDITQLRIRAQLLAEKFAVTIIDDKGGCVDPKHGPRVYSLAGDVA